MGDIGEKSQFQFGEVFNLLLFKLLQFEIVLEMELHKKISESGNLEEVMQQLNDLNEKSFFIECIADRDDEESQDFLTKAIRNETDVRVIKSLLKTMTELKSNKFAPYISDFLYSDDKELVALAVEALGSCSLCA